MRRNLIIAVMLMFSALLMSSCGNGLEAENNRPKLEFKSKFEVDSKKLPIKGKVIRSQAGEIEISIDLPEALNGLKIKNNGEENSISKDGLTYKTDELVLPETSSLNAILEVIDYIVNNKDVGPFFKDSKEMAFIGKTAAGKFELRADKKTGFITEIKIGEQDTIKFFDQEKFGG